LGSELDARALGTIKVVVGRRPVIDFVRSNERDIHTESGREGKRELPHIPYSLFTGRTPKELKSERCK